MKINSVLTILAIALHLNQMEAQPPPHSVERAPIAGGHTRSDVPPFDGLSLLDERAFGYEYVTANWVKFNLATPGTLITLGTFAPADNIFAGDFTNDASAFYAIKGSTQQLIRVDTSNGAYTVVGLVTIQTGHTWTSMKFDPTNGTLFATSTNITVSTLYTINPANGTTTVVATITGMQAIIGMAISPTGQMYGYDIVSDNFFSIDKTTGVGAVIGSIGFNANQAQDMDFDPETGILYMAAYNAGLTPATGELRTVNLATGGTTLIGTLGVPQRLIDPFAIKGNATVIAVTAPPAAANWLVGTQQTVRWTSQNLTGAVNIKLSTDGGTAFPITLVSNTPNDSAETITVPNNAATTCRVRVESASNPTIFGTNPGNFVISLDQQAPVVQHAPPASVQIGQVDTVSANITDNIGVIGATLSYRKGGSTTYVDSAMSLVGTTYRGIVPGNAVTSQGLEYFITARDAAGNIGRSPATGVYSVAVVVGGEGISRGVAQPAGSAQTAYRLISIPMYANLNSPRDVLEDDLGVYDNTKWRFFELRADQTYIEYPNTSLMTPGKCFWLIVKDAGKIVDSGPGKTATTSGTFLISLNRGWNFIANPFNFPIPRDSISVNGRPPKLTFYNGQWDSVSATTMNPFEGYIVAADSTTNLAIRPQLSLLNRQGDQPAISSERMWGIRVIAQCQDAKDIDNLAAVFSNSSTEQDGNDEPEPPVIGDYVSVSFPHPEWNNAFRRYSVDARPEPTHGAAWKFEVNTNIHSAVRLDFKGIESVPQQFEVILVDDLLKTTMNLRTTTSYSYHNANASPPKQMTLVVGTATYIQQQIAVLGAIPASFELSQNFPNPFNPTTTIRYGLPTGSYVTMKVYNVLGQEVVTLVDGLEEKGYKTVEFNAGNLSSGVYFYRIQAEGFNEIRKLTIMK